jgi:hypothetical protein
VIYSKVQTASGEGVRKKRINHESDPQPETVKGEKLMIIPQVLKYYINACNKEPLLFNFSSTFNYFPPSHIHTRICTHIPLT